MHVTSYVPNGNNNIFSYGVVRQQASEQGSRRNTRPLTIP